MEREFTAVSVRVLIAASVGLLVSVGPMIASTFGVFMATFGTVYGISRTQFSSVILLTTLLGAIGTPLAGRAIDRFGVRGVILPGVLLFGLALMSVSLVQGRMWQFYLAYGAIGLTAGVQNTVPYSKLLSLWFHRHRGKVLALMSAASGVSYAIMPQIARATIAAHGWHWAYLLLGALAVVSLLVLVPWLRMPDPAQRAAMAGDSNALPGDTPASARRDPVFWGVGALLFLAVFSFVGTTAHTFPMLLDRGLSPVDAATVLSVFALGTILGQVSYGYVLDRVASPKVAVPYVVMGLAGMMLIHRAGQMGLLMPGAVLMGVGQGAELGLAAYLVSRYFGTRHFGEIYGWIFAGATVASGVGPVVFGIAFDRSGSYLTIDGLSEMAVVVAVIGLMLLPAYRYGGLDRREAAVRQA